MAWKRGSYRPAPLAPYTPTTITPEQEAAEKESIAALMEGGMDFFEAFRQVCYPQATES